MNRQQKRRVIKAANTLFDKILTSAEGATRSFDVKKLPLINLRIILNNSKVIFAETDALKNYQEAINLTLEILYNWCQGQSRGQDVSIRTLKKGIEIIKKAHAKGVNNPEKYAQLSKN